MCCHFLLQGIFLTQGSKQCLLPWQMDSLPVRAEKPTVTINEAYKGRGEKKRILESILLTAQAKMF